VYNVYRFNKYNYITNYKKKIENKVINIVDAETFSLWIHTVKPNYSTSFFFCDLWLHGWMETMFSHLFLIISPSLLLISIITLFSFISSFFLLSCQTFSLSLPYIYQCKVSDGYKMKLPGASLIIKVGYFSLEKAWFNWKVLDKISICGWFLLCLEEIDSLSLSLPYIKKK